MIEKVKHPGLALAILAAAQFMVILDATIVNVALPAIQQALGFNGDSQLQWVVTAYALVFGGFLLLGGRLADLFGRRRLFLAGIVVFAIASLLGGLAQDPTTLIVFRSLQGLGGALLSPAALSLVLTIFKEGSARNRALGVWSMVAAGGGAVGLLLGGVLTQYIDWRWVFFINVPIAVAVIFLAMRFVPKSLPSAKQRVDFMGALTITGSIMSLVYALAKVPQNGWGSTVTISVLALSAVLMAAFIINESLVRQPLIKLSIFRRRNVTGGSLIQLLMPAAMFGFFFYLSIYLQSVLGYSPTRTGLAVFVVVTAATTNGISHEESGLVSGLLNTGQQVGGAIGLAVLSVISATVTKAEIVAAHGNPAAITPALVHGFQQGFLAASGFAVVASLIALTVFKVHKPVPGDTPESEVEAEALAAIPGA